MSDPDPNVLLQAARGDHDALSRLVKQHGLVVRRRLADKIPRQWQSVLSVDDVMQQTYTDAFVYMDRFDPNGSQSFTSWLMTLARCNLIDAVRMLDAEKRGKGRRRIEPQPADDSMAALTELLGVTGSTPSRHAARAEACDAVRTAIEQLPDAYRMVIELHDIRGQPMASVAEALQRSPGAAYMIRARALRRLRALMGDISSYLTTT